MSLKVTVMVSTPGAELSWPAGWVDDLVLAGEDPKEYVETVERALTRAQKVLVSKLKALYGDSREN